MPIAYRVDPDARLVIAAGYGVVTTADIFAYQGSAWCQPEVQGFNELIDMTLATDFSTASPERVRRLADLSAAMDQPATKTRLAVVASANVAYGLGRMFQSYRHMDERSTKEVGIFRTMPEAMAFLGLGHLPVMPEIL